MLAYIHIQNFTIIESLTLDFEDGLSVLTGETGAGKSIWVDAISYALGTRADSSIVRHGETRCEITLCFNLNIHSTVHQWLKENNYDNEGECHIRRIIFVNDPSRASINGRPCSLQLLRELGALLLNIHGQHENQALLKRSTQQQCLDTYAKHEKHLEEIHSLYNRWKMTSDELEQLKQEIKNRSSELDLLRYQRDELASQHLKENEWEELSHKHQQLHHAHDLFIQLNKTIGLVTENEKFSASQALQQAIHQLDNIRFDDPQIKSAKELLNTSAIYLQEASDALDHYRNNLDLSPESLAATEERLTKIHELARKHHTHPQNLLNIQQSFARKIEQLDNADTQIDALQKIQQEVENQYQAVAEKLSDSRKKAAKELEKIITSSIKNLGMEGGLFSIQLEKREESLHPEGQEKIHFLIRTNPGQPFQALSKIVSGGELSRISLALQSIIAKKDQTSTMIFDEVDTGIGGKIAETVGQLLRQLGNTTQVLCITHLAQVAAQGHHHYKITKLNQEKSTTVEVKKLNEKERINELARMISGAKITEQTLAYASELIQR